jgi:16S rRNA (guanine527-N7)-methyltransferase
VQFERDITWFDSICKKNSIELSKTQIELFQTYVNLLLQKNKEVNLISRNSEKFIWEEHILHSISFLFKVKINPNSEILDLGTGGGLPGVPIKIIIPDLKITFLDSTKKKILALSEFLSQLKLVQSKAVSFRAEEASENYKNKYDYVIARGVSTIKELVNWAYPFLKTNENSFDENFIPSGSLLVQKGGDISKEISQVNKHKKIKNLEIINLDFQDSDTLKNPDKKLIVVSF